jgi:transcriptional regulator with GAF, ATPase, and Fis domain
MKETLASFFEITASLSAHTRFEPLLQSVLLETIKIAQAQAGLIYLTKTTAELDPLKGLIINGQPQDLTTQPQPDIDPDSNDNPPWLQGLFQGHDSVAHSLSLEQAGDLQPIMAQLGSQSIHLIGIRLHNRHGETVGILLLVLNDSGSSDDQDHLRADRIAFIQAVSGAPRPCRSRASACKHVKSSCSMP